ncbi:MAG: dipeptidase [Gemmatimonadetes bacterium]|nr:dipeptidase [Gemmatimonadota bacterium]
MHRLPLLLLGFALLLISAAAAAPSIIGRLMNRTLHGASGPVGKRARALQETLAVADLHADALLWNRDLLSRGSWGHVDVPRLVEGRVALQVFTTVTKTPRGMNIESNAGDSDNVTLLAVLGRWPRRTWSSFLERSLYQAAKLRTFAAMSGGRLTVVRTRGELAEYIAGRMADDSVTAGILGIEGAQALEDELANVNRLFLAGFRLIGLTHFFDNEVGGSAHGLAKGGLTPFGRQVVERMEELGIVVDLAHASPALIDDVLAMATRPVIVSHTGVTGTCDNARNLDDDRLAAVAATGGVVGIGLWDTALCGTAPADWARAVHHAVDVVGVQHVGLGSDWDGAVAAMIDASQTIHLTQALVDEGFTDGDIRLIMGGNVLRVFSLTLPD